MVAVALSHKARASSINTTSIMNERMADSGNCFMISGLAWPYSPILVWKPFETSSPSASVATL